MRFRAAVLVYSLAVVGACSDNGQPSIRLSEGAVGTLSNQAAGAGSLRVAVAAITSPQVTFEKYEGLLNYLSDSLNRPVELVQRRTYAEANELIRSRDAVLGFVCAGPYVVGRRDFGLEILAVPQVNHESTYYSYIIVSDESPADSLSDLRGRSFAFTDPLSNTGYLAPMWRLHELGLSSNGFFSSTSFTYSHDNSVRAVADHVVEGAAVDSLVYDDAVEHNPRYRAEVRLVEKLGPYPNAPVVVHPDLSPEIKERLRELLLGMAGTPEGRAALAPLRIDRFVVLPDSDYDVVRRMAALIRRWTDGG